VRFDFAALVQTARSRLSDILDAVKKRLPRSGLGPRERDEEPAFAKSPRPFASPPPPRIDLSTIKSLLGKKPVMIALISCVALIAILVSVGVSLSRPLRAGTAITISKENRAFLDTLIIPEPPLPYSDVFLSRDPLAPPTAEELKAWYFAPSGAMVDEALAQAAKAVDDYFIGVK
jgi:hypothetical protein